MSPFKSLLALTAALGLLGSAGTALAQTSSTCATNTDCQHGYTCQVTAIVYGTTPACPPDSPCITTGTGSAATHDAKDGGTPTPTGGSNGGSASGAGGSAPSGDVPPNDAGTSDAGSGIVSTISTCQPGPCTADGDCATGMICHGQTETTCTGSAPTRACDAGTKCDTGGGTEPTCTTQTVSTCTFKWALPCNTNDDCGDGFFCQPTIGGTCSGGGTVVDGGTTGNSGSAVLDDSCTTTSTFPGYCRSLVTACTTNADCPSVWICQDNAVPVAGTGSSPGASDGGVSSSSGSGASMAGGGADVAPPENTKMCLAPNTASVGDGGRTGSSPSTSPTAAGGTAGNGSSQGTNDGSGSSGGAGGTQAPMNASGSGTGGSSGTHELGSPTSTDNSGGCAVIPSPGSSGAGLLALAGLATLVARRRRR